MKNAQTMKYKLWSDEGKIHAQRNNQSVWEDDILDKSPTKKQNFLSKK